jgi:plastocyanin
MPRRRATLAGATALLVLVACGASSSAAPPQGAVRVSIKGFDYSPRRLVVSRGTKVTWTDRDSTNHTVMFRDHRVRGIDNLHAGERRTVRFTRRGRFRYVCEFHPNMHGVVIVR